MNLYQVYGSVTVNSALHHRDDVLDWQLDGERRLSTVFAMTTPDHKILCVPLDGR